MDQEQAGQHFGVQTPKRLSSCGRVGFGRQRVERRNKIGGKSPARSCLIFNSPGRARWKIENETFNTLKNQGYHLEHNYGHGEQNLSVVLALMMMLAFLVDQVQQLCCPLFQAAWHKMKT